MSVLTDAFHVQYKEIMKDSLGTNSIFEATSNKLTEKLNDLGITSEEQAKLITSTLSQMSVSISASSMSTALELVLREGLTTAQVATEEKKLCVMDSECAVNTQKVELLKDQQATETEKKNLTVRQTQSFDDKNRQEAMKSMAGIAQMMGTTGDIDATGTVYSHHKTTVNNVINKTNTAI